jgi:hypothetical protein
VRDTRGGRVACGEDTGRDGAGDEGVEWQAHG